MTSPSCPFCGLVASARSSFCGRCGGPLAAPGSVDRVLATLSRAGTLVRNGVWRLARKTLAEALQTVGDADILARARFRPLLGIGWDVKMALAVPPGHHVADLLSVARTVLAALPADLFDVLRRRVDRLAALRWELENRERQCAEQVVSEAKTRRWFDGVTGRLQLDPTEAQRLAYATPWTWPTVARDLDPEEYRRAEPSLQLARAEKVLAAGDYTGAADLFDACLATNPRTPRALEGLGLVRARLGDLAAAVGFYRRAVALGTRNPVAFNNLAWYLVVPEAAADDALIEARSAAQRAVDLAPIAAFWDTFATVLLRLGDLPAAARAAREALLIAPEKTDYREKMRQIVEAFDRRVLPSAAPSVGHESDSEFELPLDDSSSGFQPLEAASPSSSGEGIIFETDFEVPALEEESGSEAVALDDSDSDVESSEFDLALEEGDVDSTDESGSQVVAMEDGEEASDADATPQRPRGSRQAQVDDGSGAMEVEEQVHVGRVEAGEDISEEVELLDLPAPTARRVVGKGLFARLRDFFGKWKPSSDRVAFSVTAPTCMVRSQSYCVDLWIHLPDLHADVLKRAQRENPGIEVFGKSQGEAEIQRGDRIDVRLDVTGLTIRDPKGVLFWQGQATSAGFLVEVPAEARPGSHAGAATFRVAGLKVAELTFCLQVGDRAPPPMTLATTVPTVRRAFASYAREDRDEVLGRVQGMLAVCPDLDVFIDVLSLRAGEHWKPRLLDEIRCRDIFYLFWSRSARASAWVEWEWRRAFEERGADYIDPVPLEPPELAPPPRELNTRHFNERLLAFRDRPRGERTV